MKPLFSAVCGSFEGIVYNKNGIMVAHISEYSRDMEGRRIANIPCLTQKTFNDYMLVVQQVYDYMRSVNQ